jgi:type IV secretory pathway VirB4 component
VPPTLAAVHEVLQRRAKERHSPDLDDLVVKLARYVTGTGRWLFPQEREGEHGTHASRPMAYVLADVPEQDRAPAMWLVLQSVWSSLNEKRERPALAVVDEGWWLMQHLDTARWVQRLAKTLRKRRAGLTMITQDVVDVLDHPLGIATVTNAAVQVLMKQAPQSIPRLAELFRLTESEQSWLLNARQGEGLLFAQGRRVPFQVVASDEEKRLIESHTALPEAA